MASNNKGRDKTKTKVKTPATSNRGDTRTQDEVLRDIEVRAVSMAEAQGALDELLRKEKEVERKMSQVEQVAAKIQTLQSRLDVFATGRSAARRIMGHTEADKDIERDIQEGERVQRQIESLTQVYNTLQEELTRATAAASGVREKIEARQQEVQQIHEKMGRDRTVLALDREISSYVREAQALKQAAKRMEQGTAAYNAALAQANKARKRALEISKERAFDRIVMQPIRERSGRSSRISASQLQNMTLEEIATTSPKRLPKGLLRSVDVQLVEDGKGSHAYKHTTKESQALDKLIRAKKLKQVSASRVANNYEGYEDPSVIEAQIRDLQRQHAAAPANSARQYRAAAAAQRLMQSQVILSNAGGAGDAYHKLIELIENGQASQVLGRKVNSASVLTPEDVKRLAQSPEGEKMLQGLRRKRVVTGRGSAFPSIETESVQEALAGSLVGQLPASLSQWNTQKKQLKIKKVLGTEVAKGGLYNTGNEIIELNGTADMIVEYEDGSIGVLDHKTSKNLHARPVSIQNAVGKRLQGTKGISTVSNVPYGKKGVAAQVGDLTDEELNEVIDDYLTGRTTTVRQLDRVTQFQSPTSAKFNLKGLPMMYGRAKKKGNDKEFVERIIQQISSLSAEEQQAILGSLFDTHVYEGGKKSESNSYYRRGEIFDILRASLPSKYRDIMTGENISAPGGNTGRTLASQIGSDGALYEGSQYGGAWLSDYVKLVKVRAQEMKGGKTTPERRAQLEQEIQNIIGNLVSSIQLGGTAADVHALLSSMEYRDGYTEGEELEEGEREGWDWFVRAFNKYGRGLTHGRIVTGEGYDQYGETTYNDDYHFMDNDKMDNAAIQSRKERGARNAYSREHFQEAMQAFITAFGGGTFEDENGERQFGFHQKITDDTPVEIDEATARGLSSLLREMKELYEDTLSMLNREGEKSAEGNIIDADNSLFIVDQIERLVANLQRRITHPKSNLKFTNDKVQKRVKDVVDSVTSGGINYTDSIGVDSNRLAWAVEGVDYYESAFAGQLNELNKNRPKGAQKSNLAESGLLTEAQLKQYQAFSIIKRVYEDWEKAEEPIEKLFEAIATLGPLGDEAMESLRESVYQGMRVNPQGYSEDVGAAFFHQLAAVPGGKSRKRAYWDSENKDHPMSERTMLLGGDIIRTRHNNEPWPDIPEAQQTKVELATINQLQKEWKERLKAVVAEIADYEEELKDMNEGDPYYVHTIKSLEDARKERRELISQLYSTGDEDVSRLAVNNRQKQMQRATGGMWDAWQQHYGDVGAVKGRRKSRVRDGASAAAYFDASFSDIMVFFQEEATRLKDIIREGGKINIPEAFHDIFKLLEDQGIYYQKEASAGFKELLNARLELLQQEIAMERDQFQLESAQTRKEVAARKANSARRKIIANESLAQAGALMAQETRRETRRLYPRIPVLSEQNTNESTDRTDAVATLIAAREAIKEFASATEEARAPLISMGEVIRTLPSYYNSQSLPQSQPSVMGGKLTPSKNQRRVRTENGGLQDVHVTSSQEPTDLTNKKLQKVYDDEGRLIAQIEQQQRKARRMMEWGAYGDSEGFIRTKVGEKKSARGSRRQREDTEAELRSILKSGGQYYANQNTGALTENGQRALEKLMERIYGKQGQSIQSNRIMVNGAPPTVEVKGASPIINVTGGVTLNTDTFAGRPGGGRSGGGGVSIGDQNFETSNDRLKEYLALLKQVEALKVQILKLDTQRTVAEQKGEDLRGVKEEIEALRREKQLIQEEADDIASEGWSTKQKKRIAQEMAINENKTVYDQDRYLAGALPQAQVDTEKEYQQNLAKRLSLEKQIEAAKKEITTSVSGREKDAQRDIIRMTLEEIQELDKKRELLEQSGLLRKEETEAILKQYNLERNSTLAKANANRHGSRNLLDVMKYDIQRSFTRVMDYGVAMRMINSIPRGLQKVNQLTQQLEESITSLRIVTGMNREEAERTMVTYQKMGRQLKATTQEVAQSATTWLRQGYAVEEAGKLIEASMKLSKLGFMDSQSAAQSLTSALKGFRLEVSSAMSVVDKLTQMDQKAAVSAQGVSEALSLIANSARLAGLSMDEAIGIVSTIGEVTQQSMSTVGNATKTMLARFSNVKAGVFAQMGLNDGGDTTENINDIEKVLRVVGITIRSASGEMRSFSDVLDDLGEKWNTFDSVTKNAIAGALGGVRQREAVNTLLENYDRYKELTEESANSEGTANQKYAAQMESLAAAITDLQNAWEKFAMDVKASPLIKGGVKFLTFLVDNMKTLLSLVSAFGGRFAAIKLPTWLPKLGGLFGLGRNGDQKMRYRLLGAQPGGVAKQEKYAQSVNDRIDELAGASDEDIDRMAHDEAFQIGLKKGKGDFTSRKNKAYKKLKKQQTAIKEGRIQKLGEDTQAIDKTDVTPVVDKLSATNDIIQQILAELRERASKEGAKTRAAKGAAQKKRQDPDAMGSAAQAPTMDGSGHPVVQDKNGKWHYAAGTKNAQGKSIGGHFVPTGQLPGTSGSVQPLLTNTDAKKTAEEMGKKAGEAQADQQKKDAQKAGGQQNLSVWNRGKFSGYGAQVAGAIGSGLTTFATGALSKNEAVEGVAVLGGKGKKAKEAGISVEADAGDKVIQGASQGLATAGLSLIPVVGPILGPVLGPLLGGAVGDLISFFRHEDEIDRKLRVEEAKKQLEALGKIATGISDLEELNKNREWTADDYKAAKEQYDIVYDQMAGNKQLSEAFLAAMQEAGFTEDSWEKALNLLMSSDQITREKTINALNGVMLSNTREQLVRSNEEIMYSGNSAEIQKALKAQREAAADEAMHTSGLNDLTSFQKAELGFEGAVQRMATFMEALGLQVRDASGKIIDEYRSVIENKLKTDEEWSKVVGNKSSTLEGILNTNETYQTSVKALQSLDKSVTQDNAKDFMANWANRVREGRKSQVEAAQEKIDAWNQQQRDYDYAIAQISYNSASGRWGGKTRAEWDEELKNYKETHKEEYEGAKEQIKILQDEKDVAAQVKKEVAELAEQWGLSGEELEGAIYAFDETALIRMAKGLGLTTEQLIAMKEELKDVSLGDLTAAPSTSREKREQYLAYYNDFVQNGTLSKENLEKAISEDPELAILSGDREAMRAYLEKKAFGQDTKEQVLYHAQMYNSMMESESFFNSQKKATNGEGDSSLEQRVKDAFAERRAQIANDSSLSALEKETLLKEVKNKEDSFSNAKSFNSAQEALDYLKQQSGEAAAAVGEKMSELLQQEVEYTVDTTQLDRVIEYQTKLIDKQIENLQQQKDALQSINDQRKKELEYTKAQIALENASEEKKRVYRAGVGFTYEEDEEAVKSAQETVNNLEIEREQELLDLQIERLELEREILEFLPDEKAAEELYNTYQNWMQAMGNEGLLGQSQTVTSALSLLYKDVESFSLHGMSAAAWESEDKLRNISAQGIIDQFTKAENNKELAELAVSNRQEGGTGFAAAQAVDKYNTSKSDVSKLIQEMEKSGISREEIERRITQLTQRAMGDVEKDENGKVVLDDNGEAKVNTIVSDDVKKRVESIMNVDTSLGNVSLGGGTLEMGTMGTQKGEASDDESVSAGSHSISEEQLLGTAEEWNKDEFEDQFKKNKYTSIRFYDPKEDKLRTSGGPNGTGIWSLNQVNAAINAGPDDQYYQELKSYGVDVENGTYGFERLRDFPIGTAFSNEDWQDYGAFVGGQHKIYSLGELATGTLGLRQDSGVLINELGTEAIVTPRGTVTALPSKTGVVPADITKNLWALGEAAPNLIARLGSINLPQTVSNNGTTHNDGTFIDTLNMTVYPTKDYDMDKFIQEAKQRARISNHNN